MPFALEDGGCFLLEEGDSFLLESDSMQSSSGRWSVVVSQVNMPFLVYGPPWSTLSPTVNETGFTVFLAIRSSLPPPYWMLITTPIGTTWAIPNGLMYVDGQNVKDQTHLQNYTLVIYTVGSGCFPVPGTYQIQLAGDPDSAPLIVTAS